MVVSLSSPLATDDLGKRSTRSADAVPITELLLILKRRLSPPLPSIEDRTEQPVLVGLSDSHVSGARLYACREDLLAAMPIRGGTIAEVGVAFGDLSEFLIETQQPSRFVAIDTFRLHEIPAIWGRPMDEFLKGRTRLQQYADRVARFGETVEIIEGRSHEALLGLPDRAFDMIYIDAGHSFAEVYGDALIAKEKIKADGVLIFNDYIWSDHTTGTTYGIVPAVNRLVVEEDWRVLGFALQPHLFCDIAIHRPTVAHSQASG
jgi:hypothetical protein